MGTPSTANPVAVGTFTAETVTQEHDRRFKAQIARMDAEAETNRKMILLDHTVKICGGMFATSIRSPEAFDEVFKSVFKTLDEVSR